jgi:hypothetical protein
LLTTTDPKALAWVNLFAVLGSLENLLDLAPEASDLVKGDKVSIGFSVKSGPSGTLSFAGGKCALSEGTANCDIKLPFGSCEKFNGLVAGTVTPIPSKGFTKIGFLLNKFTPLAGILEKYLRPEASALKNPEFAKINTLLLLCTASAAASQVGNHDRSGIFSASQMPDGDIAVDIAGVTGVTIQVKGHKMTTIKKKCENPRAVMEFRDLDAAGRLLRGELSGMAAICDGSVRMMGMVNMIDNLNRILDRVSQYLA